MRVKLESENRRAESDLPWSLLTPEEKRERRRAEQRRLAYERFKRDQGLDFCDYYCTWFRIRCDRVTKKMKEESPYCPGDCANCDFRSAVPHLTPTEVERVRRAARRHFEYQKRRDSTKASIQDNYALSFIDQARRTSGRRSRRERDDFLPVLLNGEIHYFSERKLRQMGFFKPETRRGRRRTDPGIYNKFLRRVMGNKDS